MLTCRGYRCERHMRVLDGCVAPRTQVQSWLGSGQNLPITTDRPDQTGVVAKFLRKELDKEPRRCFRPRGYGPNRRTAWRGSRSS
jgi:hypothetical protein